MKIETRSFISWYGRRRHRWYLLSPGEQVVGLSARSYAYEQQAWEAAQDYFAAAVTMVYNHGEPDGWFEIHAEPRVFK